MLKHLKKFEQGDVYYSSIKLYPHNSFFLYEGMRFWNNNNNLSGVICPHVGIVPPGYLSLYEMNVDRHVASDTYNADTDTGVKHLIRPFTLKTNNSYVSTFKRLDSSSFFAKKPTIANGDYRVPILTGSYPLSSSITTHFYSSTTTRSGSFVGSLKNVLKNYGHLSPHFTYSSSFLGVNNRNFDNIEMNLVDIPSIFYGSGVKKGSVVLKFFISGTLCAELQDVRKNGELVQTNPIGSNGSGSVGGIILYDNGIIVLTSSVTLSTLHGEDYRNTGGSLTPRWTYFGTTVDYDLLSSTPSSSYLLEFQGIEKVPTLNMVVHALQGEFNHSNNPTYIKTGSFLSPFTSSYVYKEMENREIANVVSSSHNDPTGSFEKITYISEINIYDEQKNLIGIGKLAKPIKKTYDRDISVRLKYDL